ncbi:MAG: PaaI family thioesterase [Pseudomonadota bacterium]
MSEEASLEALSGARDAINADVARLIQYLRCGTASPDTLEEARSLVAQAIQVIEPFHQDGDGWSTISIAGDNSGLAWKEDDLTHVMPYSPVSGKHNAVAPPLRLRKEGEGVRGEVVFSPTYAGPPDSVHGGVIAAVFDEVLAMANVVSGKAGFTGTLTIRYHSTTPLNTTVELFGENTRQDGRKQIARGEMRANGKLTASAEGLFICAAEELQS